MDSSGISPRKCRKVGAADFGTIRQRKFPSFFPLLLPQFSLFLTSLVGVFSRLEMKSCLPTPEESKCMKTSWRISCLRCPLVGQDPCSGRFAVELGTLVALCRSPSNLFPPCRPDSSHQCVALHGAGLWRCVCRLLDVPSNSLAPAIHDVCTLPTTRLEYIRVTGLSAPRARSHDGGSKFAMPARQGTGMWDNFLGLRCPR